MEITLKITENQPELLRALAKLMEHPESADEPVPERVESETAESKEVAPPWEEGVPPVKAPEPEPDAEDLRSQIRALGGRLTVAGKAEQLQEIFKKHGSAKLSKLDDAVLPEVLTELEAL